MTSAKPFVIPKRLVWEAYQRVKANRGSAGIDGQSIKDFDLKLGKKKSLSRGHKTRAFAWLERVRRRTPDLFVHWCGRGRFSVEVMGAQ